MTTHAIVDDYGKAIEVIDCDDDEDGEYVLASEIGRLIDLWLELQDDEQERTSFTIYKDGSFTMFGFAFMGNGNLHDAPPEDAA